MHGETETSYLPRIVGMFLHTAILGAAGWILLGDGLETVGSWIGREWGSGDFTRRIILFTFCCVLWVRMLIAGFWLLQRRFDWSELVGVTLACVVYHLGFALLGAPQTAPIGPLDLLGLALFLLGSWLNTWSEIQRREFKCDPSNRGKLFMGGLFRLARHINYFGDTLWVIGWAMLTHSLWAAVVPTLLTLAFVFGFIPLLSGHLKQRYGTQYDEWTAKTRKFIPFVY